jgi:hypothetical protein
LAHQKAGGKDKKYEGEAKFKLVFHNNVTSFNDLKIQKLLQNQNKPPSSNT